MKKNTLNKLVFLFAGLLVLACTPKKIIVAPPPAGADTTLVSDKKTEALELLKAKDLAFQTLSLRAKANLNIGGNENNVSMQLRMQKDQKIWVSITAIAGIEVARAMITPDSLLIRNNLERTYIKKPFSFIYGYANKQITFKWLQSVLSGNTIGDFMQSDADLQQENGVWVLTGLSSDLAYRSLFNTLLKVQETSLNDARAGQAFKVNYDNYTPIAGGLFPSTTKINSQSGTKAVQIELNFTRVEANVSLDYPFTVPKSFEVIN